MKEVRDRKLNVVKRKPGMGGNIFKISLPAKWIRKMGLSEEERDLIITFEDDKKIIIEKNNEKNDEEK